jgi:hypothetical protein
MTVARQVGRSLISDGDFNRLLMDILDWTGKYMDGEEAINPHLLAFYALPDRNYDLNVLVTSGFVDGEAKETMMTMGAKAAEGDHPLAAAFLITEAWMSQREAEDHLPEVPPSEDPERIEIVIISGSTIDQRQNQVIVKTERRDGLMYVGEVISAPYIDDDEDQIQNRMLMQFWRAYAEEILKKKSSDS